VSISGIALPFLLGALAALFICHGSTYFQNGVSPWEGACFLGAAMCITAFPVLARIITERGLLGTSIGTLALAAGATNDAIAWIILAVVLATFKSTPMIAFAAIGGGVVYVLAMTTLGRRLMTAFEKAVEGKDHLPTPIAALAFLVLIACAWYTEAIGIYAVFGAFVCGACMPHGHFAALMKRVLEPITGGLLVPLYFVYAGLNAKVQLLGSTAALGIGAVLILLAIAGKWGGCMLAARRAGETWRDSASIGILMNARGLMELMILNIGLQAGVITQTLYTVMVLMAIVTTLMTTPIYGLLNRRAKQAVMNAEPA
jgi:Kef-type K+ transport system membrane component KefB